MKQVNIKLTNEEKQKIVDLNESCENYLEVIDYFDEHYHDFYKFVGKKVCKEYKVRLKDFEKGSKWLYWKVDDDTLDQLILDFENTLIEEAGIDLDLCYVFDDEAKTKASDYILWCCEEMQYDIGKRKGANKIVDEIAKNIDDINNILQSDIYQVLELVEEAGY